MSTYHRQLIEEAKARRARLYGAGHVSSELEIISGGEAARRRWAALQEQFEHEQAERQRLMNAVIEQKWQDMIAQARETITMPPVNDNNDAEAESVATSHAIIQKIKIVVSTERGVMLKDLMGDRRQGPVVLARQIAVHLAVKLTARSLSFIGHRFQRDHTTIIHANRKIEERRAADPDFDAELRRLESLILPRSSHG